MGIKSVIKKHKVKSFIAGLFVFWLLYYSSGYFFVYNNDAYVDGNLVKVNSVVSGPITEIYIKDNQFVTKGEPLYKIEQSPFIYRLDKAKADYLAAQAQLAQVKSNVQVTETNIQVAEANYRLQDLNYQRAKRLIKTNAISQEQYDQQRASYDVALSQLEQAKLAYQTNLDQIPVIEMQIKAAQAQIDSAQYDLDNTIVYAPFDGYINNLRVYPGDYSLAGMAVFGLLQAGGWEIIANIKENQLQMIEPGKQVIVYLPSRPWHLYTGTVKSVRRAVARSADEESVANPYIQPTTSWVRYPYRLAVSIELNGWTDQQKNELLAMGVDAKIIVLPFM